MTLSHALSIIINYYETNMNKFNQLVHKRY